MVVEDPSRRPPSATRSLSDHPAPHDEPGLVAAARSGSTPALGELFAGHGRAGYAAGRRAGAPLTGLRRRGARARRREAPAEVLDALPERDPPDVVDRL